MIWMFVGNADASTSATQVKEDITDFAENN